MKHITFFLDFISPYAWLAFDRLPEALMGHSYSVTYKPVLLGALLQHHGQLGPAEIGAKRDWTYRHVLWLGHHHGVPLQMPAAHPFNPLPLLRLAVACDPQGVPNRYVCETIFRHVWEGGADAVAPERLQALQKRLQPVQEVSSQQVKDQLKQHTDAAITAGAFGVPGFAVDDKLFWGFDALPMLAEYLRGDPWFGTKNWTSPSAIPQGITRRKSV